MSVIDREGRITCVDGQSQSVVPAFEVARQVPG